MRRWPGLLPTLLLGCVLLVNSVSPLLAHSQEAATSRKNIYIFNPEFPPSVMAQYPTPPLQETRFWQLLDKNFNATGDLALTQNLEDADYQVELRCSGVVNCTRLIVDVKDAKRTQLVSFSFGKYTPYWGLGAPNLPYVAQQLSEKLNEHLKLLNQGGYGYSE